MIHEEEMKYGGTGVSQPITCLEFISEDSVYLE